MKLPILFAAFALTAVPAVAQMETQTEHRTVTTERHITHSDDRRGYNHGVRRVCKWRWQGHRHVRVCRTVRWH